MVRHYISGVVLVTDLDIAPSSLHEIVSHDRKRVTGTYRLIQSSYPRTEDEETKTNKVWLKGHTGM